MGHLLDVDPSLPGVIHAKVGPTPDNTADIEPYLDARQATMHASLAPGSAPDPDASARRFCLNAKQAPADAGACLRSLL